IRAEIGQLVKYKKINWVGVDEAHRISTRNAKQSKAISRLHWVTRKLILTGTPIEKRPTDMFAQFRFLAPEVFGTRWEDFEKEYLEFKTIDISRYSPGTPAWQRKVLQQRILKSKATFNPKKLPQFIRLIKPFSFRLSKEDVGIKPTKVVKVVVPMLGHQRRCYEEMERDSITVLPSGKTVMADMEITAIMKRRQLASGFIYDEDGELEYIGGSKLRRLIRMFKELPKPVVIFTAFTPDANLIHNRLIQLGYDVDLMYGKTKKKQRPGMLRDFQKAQKDGIVCQIKTGGVGVDLWKANSGIIHSLGHSFIDWDQAKARMDSKDKNVPATIYVLCSEKTVDEDIYELVLVKHQTGITVLKQLRRRNHYG
ncbi:MAG: DEAD/DEAH box helicase, partial [Nitrospirales bacterium]